MSEKIMNIALVGCGGMARGYREVYTQIPGACLALIVDIDEAAAREAATELQVKHFSSKFEDCLSCGIDIVDISTPNHFHREQAIKAAKHGKHILLQKPIAPTVEDAEEIVENVRKNGVVAGMFMSERCKAVYYDLKEMITQGHFGKISSVFSRNSRIAGYHKLDSSNWRSSLEKTGGGSFIQLAIHSLNILQWMLNDRISCVSAFSKNLMCPHIGGDDVTGAIFEFESGILGTAESSYCADGTFLSIYGTEGGATVSKTGQLTLKACKPYNGTAFSYLEAGFEKSFQIDERPQFNISNPYEQHVAFVNAVIRGKQPPVPVDDGLRDLKLVQAIYKSATEKRFIYV